MERRLYIIQRWPENFVEIHPDDAKKRNIESGDYVIMHNESFSAHKDTIIGVHNDHFQFSELMKRGHIELYKELGDSKYKTEFRSMSFAPRNIV